MGRGERQFGALWQAGCGTRKIARHDLFNHSARLSHIVPDTELAENNLSARLRHFGSTTQEIEL